MIGFVLRWWKPFAVVVICAGLWLHGYTTAVYRCETRHKLAAAKAATAQAQAITELAAAEQRARLLANELEDAARAEPPATSACLPRSRVLRLNSR
ncbi:hypothetical protein [Fuscibacter oryzae]|uniref:Uncharacterized protein n=1 Tax=Fuscibacter oryzae TaxID=2803939 RepID=A0A8J7MX07_9RHOB|nr:hypothetical protein [Fuscibacter oryzae]MBL4929329.1 hypothetical protein [Fuscibacter oryzae]